MDASKAHNLGGVSSAPLEIDDRAGVKHIGMKKPGMSAHSCFGAASVPGIGKTGPAGRV
jgi:hypothetical protein